MVNSILLCWLRPGILHWGSHLGQISFYSKAFLSICWTLHWMSWTPSWLTCRRWRCWPSCQAVGWHVLRNSWKYQTTLPFFCWRNPNQKAAAVNSCMLRFNRFQSQIMEQVLYNFWANLYSMYTPTPIPKAGPDPCRAESSKDTESCVLILTYLGFLVHLKQVFRRLSPVQLC